MEEYIYPCVWKINEPIEEDRYVCFFGNNHWWSNTVEGLARNMLNLKSEKFFYNSLIIVYENSPKFKKGERSIDSIEANTIMTILKIGASNPFNKSIDSYLSDRNESYKIAEKGEVNQITRNN